MCTAGFQPGSLFILGSHLAEGLHPPVRSFVERFLPAPRSPFKKQSPQVEGFGEDFLKGLNFTSRNLQIGFRE